MLYEVITKKRQRHVDNAKLLPHLADRSLAIPLSGLEMPTDAAVPAAGLNLLVYRPFLQQHLAAPIEDQDMNSPMDS